MRCKHKDGTYRLLEGTGTNRLDEAGVGAVVLNYNDTTLHRRDEKSLRLLNSAVMHSTESILITDAQLDQPGPRIVFVNPAFEAMTGYTAAEVTRTPHSYALLRGHACGVTIFALPRCVRCARPFRRRCAPRPPRRGRNALRPWHRGLAARPRCLANAVGAASVAA